MSSTLVWLRQDLRLCDHPALQAALAADIEALGGQLIIRHGPLQRELVALSKELGVDQLVCSRSYEPWAAALEQALHQPEKISNGSGLPYKVFTPFWKACRREPAPGLVLPAPESICFIEHTVASLQLAELKLLPTAPNWAGHWLRHWQP
jgi:deoxyribodipyrimidine photo-lyase